MEKIEVKIFEHFKNLSDQIMSKEATNNDIIDDLMRSLTSCQSKMNDLQRDSEVASKIIEIALEGLYAIARYGDSQDIAKKTLDQINELRIKK